MVTVLFGWVASFFRTSIIGAGNEVRKHMEMLWDITKALFLWILDNLVFINIILSILIIFFQRRNPTAVWTWLLVLYFIPIVGFLLYLVVGQDYRKSRMFKMKEIRRRNQICGKKAGGIHLQEEAEAENARDGAVSEFDPL